MKTERLNELSGEIREWVAASRSPARTVSMGEVFGRLLPEGATVSFEGGLGSGKTCFIKGVCSGLGIRGEVLSPSFILVEEYRGDFNVLHFDLYRLEELGDVYQTGLFDAADGMNIILVEWGDRLPENCFDFDITVRIDMEGEKIRTFRFIGPANFIDRLMEAADG
ncbi:MAG: tRNA (adenosine(37)-N6)-threonylcarbamoyltransferase complex ATPase subunit type 1 TsaE [Candidatus Krumholzibacteriales bacterium]